MAEMISGVPLFRGRDNNDQLNQILRILGTPDENMLRRLMNDSVRDCLCPRQNPPLTRAQLCHSRKSRCDPSLVRQRCRSSSFTPRHTRLVRISLLTLTPSMRSDIRTLTQQRLTSSRSFSSSTRRSASLPRTRCVTLTSPRQRRSPGCSKTLLGKCLTRTDSGAAAR